MKISRSAGAFSPDDMRQTDEDISLASVDQAYDAHPRALAALAETAGGLGLKPHYSPIVLVGLVRLIEFALLCIDRRS